MPPPFQRAIVSVTNDLATDNRVRRTCDVLTDLEYEVLLVGRKLPGSLPLDRPYRTKRMRLLFNKGPLFYAEYNLRLFFLLLFSRATLYFSNDLDTLLPNHLAARIRGKKLVYDTHEFYTEVPELVDRPKVRAVWLAIERRIFPKLPTVITVNASIAAAYAERYGNSVHVVRNIPPARDLGPLLSREALGLPLGKRILVMQGAGINVQRGAEEAVLAMRELPECLLLIIGGGDAWPVLEKLVHQHDLQDRSDYWGRCPTSMMAYTRNAIRPDLTDTPINTASACPTSSSITCTPVFRCWPRTCLRWRALASSIRVVLARASRERARGRNSSYQDRFRLARERYSRPESWTVALKPRLRSILRAWLKPSAYRQF